MTIGSIMNERLASAEDGRRTVAKNYATLTPDSFKLPRDLAQVSALTWTTQRYTF